MKSPGKDALNDIIEGCKNGDRKSQKKIYQWLYPKMLGVCLRFARDKEQAKDILQDGFIKVFTNIHLYNKKGSFEGWVRRIVRNTAIDFYRQHKKRFVALEDEHEQSLKDEKFSKKYDEQSIFERIKKEDMIREVQNLPPAYRMVFNLYVIEGHTHKEIGEKLGISEGTSKSNLSKAKAKLKKAFLVIVKKRNV